ncbi:hypothetical protein [Vibrio sp. ED002]|uniref:hypothetical protein n=1 Tax=Vibrio sp. ED002 TaxID=2785123 RepID=UPI00200DDED5|nr:hypothetical protein [Vibrio sp. ED002]UQA51681.1 hypothetical protein ITG12_04950 [Vibrio sp. ED002]
MINIIWLLVSVAFGVLWGRQVSEKDDEISRLNHELYRKLLGCDSLMGDVSSKREEIGIRESIIKEAGLNRDYLVAQKFKEK